MPHPSLPFPLENCNPCHHHNQPGEFLLSKDPSQVVTTGGLCPASYKDTVFLFTVPHFRPSSMGFLWAFFMPLFLPASLSLSTLRHKPLQPPPPSPHPAPAKKMHLGNWTSITAQECYASCRSPFSPGCARTWPTPVIVSVVFHDDVFRIWLGWASSWSYPGQVIWQGKKKLPQASPTHLPCPLPPQPLPWGHGSGLPCLPCTYSGSDHSPSPC